MSDLDLTTIEIDDLDRAMRGWARDLNLDTETVTEVVARIVAARMPEGHTRDEFAVERKWGLEIGGSVGMSHNYPYTADSVKGLADGNPIFVRERTTYRDHLGEWEPFGAGAEE